MNKITNSLLGCAFATLLYSCEGGTTFTKTINNTSSETLTVTVHSSFGSNVAEVINPNEEKQIYWDDRMGNFVDDTYTCTNELDSIGVVVSNGKILLKDLMDSNNWERESKGGRNSREDCTIIISDEDLQ